MLFIPRGQAATGVGNTTIIGEGIDIAEGSIQIIYKDDDGTIYSGAETLTYTVSASNEPATEYSQIVAWVEMQEATNLNAATPSMIIDTNGKYRHLKIEITTYVDGQADVYFYPVNSLR